MINPIKNNKKNHMISEEDIPQIYHDLMQCYGWIPLKEFEDLPMKIVFKLHKKVVEHMNNEIKYKKAVLKGLGHKI